MNIPAATALDTSLNAAKFNSVDLIGSSAISLQSNPELTRRRQHHSIDGLTASGLSVIELESGG